MGVHGLTSFLGQHSSLGETVLLSGADGALPAVPLIVDGLALLYHIALIDTVRAGQFRQVRANLAQYIKYWRACGLGPELVFDGPSEHTKRETVLSRSTQTMSKCIKYMSATDAERATPRMRAMVQRMPGMTLTAAVAELRKLHVPLHFAEGEADAGAAELAERKGGYVLSSDSDYFIFPSNCRGYVPLSTMEYGETSSNRLELIDSVLPVHLRFKAIKYTDVARLLGIAPAFLPLFAALVGNDQADYAQAFAVPSNGAPVKAKKGKGGKKEKGSTLMPKRPAKGDKLLLPHIARELAKLAHLAPALDQPPLPGTPDPLSTVLNLVLPVLGVPTPPLQMIHDLLLSAASYELQPLSASSSTFPLHPRQTDNSFHATSRALYLAAFKRGELPSTVLQVLKHRMVIRSGSLEMAERPSPSLVLGSHVRRWIYAVLENALFEEGQLQVTEYQRSGKTLREVDVAAPRLKDVVLEAMGASDIEWGVEQPIIQGSPALRFHLLLLAFGGLSNELRANALWPLILALRHLKRFLLVVPWTRREYTAALLTGALLVGTTKAPHFKLGSPPPKELIQRSTELSTALSQVQLLAEALLVVGELGEGVSIFFDGKILHGCLGLSEERLEKAVAGLGRREREWVAVAMEAVMAD